MATLFSPLDWQNIVFSIEPFIDNEMALKRKHAADADRSICKYYQKGSCMRSSDCPYRHSRGDKAIVCKHWLRGLCKKSDQCEFLHEYDLTRMPNCHFFSTFGSCSNPDCPFLHIKSIEGDKECPWYQRGFCKHGPNCHSKHTRRAACPDYLSGFCPAGPLCTLAHPKFELITEAPTAINNGDDSTAGDYPSSSSGGGRHGVTAQSRKPLSMADLECHYCHQTGHFAAACPNISAGAGGPGGARSVRPLKAVTCFKCGENGHYASVCTNKRQAPPAGGYQLPKLGRGGSGAGSDSNYRSRGGSSNYGSGHVMR